MGNVFMIIGICCVVASCVFLLLILLNKNRIPIYFEEEESDPDEVMVEGFGQEDPDYYDLEIGKRLGSCLFSFKAISVLILLYLAFHLIKLIYEWI